MSRCRIAVVAIAAALAALGSQTVSVAGVAGQVDPPSRVEPLQPAGRQLLTRRAVVRVPDLPPFATISSAMGILRNAGLKVRSALCDPSSGTPGAPAGRITRLSPASGTAVAVGSDIDLVVVQSTTCARLRMFSRRDLRRIERSTTAPPPPPPPPPTQTCPDGFMRTTFGCMPMSPSHPPPPPPPPAEPERDPDEGTSPTPAVHPRPIVRPRPALRPTRPTAAPTINDEAPAEGPPLTAPATDTGPMPATDIGPTPEAEKGRGAFVEPGDMELENWHRLEFVVGRTDAALAEESEDQELTASKSIYVAPVMRVTLLPDPNFEIRPQSPAIQQTGADRAASWQWSVRPLRGGTHELLARVEVLQRAEDGSLTPAETYTRRVAVHVRVGTWKGFLNALKGAASFGDLLGTLFRSWEKTLLALTALIAAAVGLWAAIRKLKKK